MCTLTAHQCAHNQAVRRIPRSPSEILPARCTVHAAHKCATNTDKQSLWGGTNPGAVRVAAVVCSSRHECRAPVLMSSSVRRAAKSRSRMAGALYSPDDLLEETPAVPAQTAIRDTLDDLTATYKALDEHLDKDYIESVVSLRDVLMEYEWRQHGKQLAERKGVALFEQHCAQHDVDVSFEALTQLYRNPHDMSVLPSTKLKLLARSMIQQTVDERYCSIYAECTAAAKELAKTGIKDILPEGAEKVGGVLKSLLPMPAFLKNML